MLTNRRTARIDRIRQRRLTQNNPPGYRRPISPRPRSTITRPCKRPRLFLDLPLSIRLRKRTPIAIEHKRPKNMRPGFPTLRRQNPRPRARLPPPVHQRRRPINRIQPTRRLNHIPPSALVLTRWIDYPNANPRLRAGISIHRRLHLHPRHHPTRTIRFIPRQTPRSSFAAPSGDKIHRPGDPIPSCRNRLHRALTLCQSSKVGNVAGSSRN